MTTPDYGVTPEGFKQKRLPQIKEEYEDLFIGEFGEINLEPQSVTGQLIGIFSKVLADDWENLSDVYLSQYLNSATGISLDNVLAMMGIIRLPASKSSVVGAATGMQGTLIPAGSLARLAGSDDIFVSTFSAIISNGSAIKNRVTVKAEDFQTYSVLIGQKSYIYSLPVINFSGPIVAGNVISVQINGVTLSPVSFDTDSQTTLNNLIGVILANVNANTATATAPLGEDKVYLTPVLGKQIIVNAVSVAGAGAPVGSVTFEKPALENIAKYLAANIDNDSGVFTTWETGKSYFDVQALSSNVPYSINVGTNLQVTSTASPVPFLAQEFGVIPVPVGSLTEILTPIAGWQSLTNFEAGITGREQETDEELRLRAKQSLHTQGAATVEAIRSRLLQEVPGVNSVTIFENVTMTQDPITILFSADFITGNAVQVQFEGSNIGIVNFSASNLQVMDDVAALIQSQDEIKTAIVGGAGNHQITLTMADGQDIEIDFNISGGISNPTYTKSGGRPPKSFETVVEGGTDDAVALKIWQLKPAGIQTFGNTHVIVTDSQGNPQGIEFTRATEVYLWADVLLVLNPQETFPTNGQQLVADAIVNYGNTLGVGTDVFVQRVQSAIFAIPGIAQASVQIARTPTPTTLPVPFGSSDIAIGASEISLWDTSRVNVGF